MKHRKPFYVIITIGIFLFIALLSTPHMLWEDNTITLPARTPESETDDDKNNAVDLNILSITPATVQAAVSTLSRPTSYQRTQIVAIYWNGGESTTTAQVSVHGGVTRIDTTLKDGTVCHTLLSDEISCVWYDDETEWTTMRAQQFSADALQRMPTYESVLELDVTQIVQAKYCLHDGVYCIYIQTAPNLDGYAERYWISTQSGLLYAAERTVNDDVIYRFSATEPGIDPLDETRFFLPNGSQFPPQ